MSDLLTLPPADRGQFTRADAALRLSECDKVWIRLVADLSREHEEVFRLEVTTASSPPGFTDASWDYGTTWFTAASLPGATAAEWITSGVVQLDGRTFGLNIAETASYERLPAHIDHDRPPLHWPYTRVTFAQAQGHWNRPDTGRFLVAPDAPSFPSYDMAAEVFFHGQRLPNSFHHSDLVTIRFIDTSARLARFAFALSALDVYIEGDRAAGCRVEFVADDASWSQLADRSGRATFDLPTGIPREWWAVVSRGYQWLDYRHISPYGRPNLTGVELPSDELDPADELAAIMLNGEGATTEFKRQLPASRDERRKVARTVAAFANGDGGVILFGIDSDEVTIVGIRSLLPAARDQLNNIVTDIVTPRPQVEVRAYEADGHLVIGLHVGPGIEPLYGVDPANPRYYVRRGASTFPARPDDVAAAVRSRTPAQVPTSPY